MFFCFQRIVFGDLDQLGYLVQKLAGAELKLDHVRRLRLNVMVETVQNPEVTANLAIHILVQVSMEVSIAGERTLFRFFISEFKRDFDRLVAI